MSVDLSIRIGLKEVEVKWRQSRARACTQPIAVSGGAASRLPDPGAIGASLNAALAQTMPRRTYLAPHIRVALADPYLRAAYLRFVQLPKSRADRRLLVTQRFCHDHNLRPAETAVAFDEGRTKGGGAGVVAASAVTAALLGEIRGLLERHGLYADIIAPESAFAVRYLSRWLSPAPRILLVIYPDYLLLMLWTGEPAPRHMAALRPETPDAAGFGAKVMRRLQRYLPAETGTGTFALDLLDAAPGSSLSDAVLDALQPLSKKIRNLGAQIPPSKTPGAGTGFTRDLILGGA